MPIPNPNSKSQSQVKLRNCNEMQRTFQIEYPIDNENFIISWMSQLKTKAKWKRLQIARKYFDDHCSQFSLVQFISECEERWMVKVWICGFQLVIKFKLNIDTENAVSCKMVHFIALHSNLFVGITSTKMALSIMICLFKKSIKFKLI